MAQPYINLCGNLAVRKGRLFILIGVIIVEYIFIPALNANSSCLW